MKEIIPIEFQWSFTPLKINKTTLQIIKMKYLHLQNEKYKLLVHALSYILS
jgi:hypothetical protein